MLKTTHPISYAGHDHTKYEWLASSSLLRGDPLAWNLAWLSWQMPKIHPDPNFTVNVYHTANLILESGKISTKGVVPDSETVRSWLQLPPPAFALRLVDYPHPQRLPMHQAYGESWLGTVLLRASRWIDPAVAEDPISDLSLAQAALAKF